MAIGAPAGHVNCFVVVVVVIGIGFDCLFSFAIRAKLAAVIDSILVVVLGSVVLIFASLFLCVRQIGEKCVCFGFLSF